MPTPIRRRSGLLWLLLPWLLACSAHPRVAAPRAEQEIRGLTQHYAELVLAMDSAGIAALFTADGEVAADGQAPIHGPAAIRAHLETFKDYHVLAESLTADRIAVAGSTGHVVGTYHQRVRLPSGEVVEVGGTYTADWVRDPTGAWHIQRMATVAQKAPGRPKG